MSATPTPLDTGEPPMDDGLRLVLPARRLSAGAGWDWIAAGWKLFVRAPLMWIIGMVLLFIIAIGMNFVPVLGNIVYQLLQGVFAAGFVAACRSLERGGEFEFEHLFAGFTRRFVPLLVLGALVLLGWIVIFLVFASIAGISIASAIFMGTPETAFDSMMASIGLILIALLVTSLLALPLLAAYWFAPALVLMHDMGPWAAMKASLIGTLRNWIPFFIYGLVIGVLFVIALVPFGLGMLVWLPLVTASSYAAYRQMFTEDAAP